MSYRLTDIAVEDVREILIYIRSVQHSPQNARRVAMRLKKRFAELVRMPHIGHQREELQDENARVVMVSGLLVLYDPTLRPLTILRVIHPARDLRRIRIR